MALTQVTVTGAFNKAPGVTSVGNLQWQLSADLFQGGLPVANRAPIPVPLVDGAFSVVLWANDDPGTTPTGTYWSLSGVVDGEGFSENYVISHTMAPTVDLSQLTPVQPSVPTFTVAQPASTVTGPDTWGEAADVGTSTDTYSRGDHNHGLPSLAAPIAFALILGR